MRARLPFRRLAGGTAVVVELSADGAPLASTEPVVGVADAEVSVIGLEVGLAGGLGCGRNTAHAPIARMATPTTLIATISATRVRIVSSGNRRRHASWFLLRLLARS